MTEPSIGELTDWLQVCSRGELEDFATRARHAAHDAGDSFLRNYPTISELQPALAEVEKLLHQAGQPPTSERERVQAVLRAQQLLERLQDFLLWWQPPTVDAVLLDAPVERPRGADRVRTVG
jgi:hypothetical protein